MYETYIWTAGESLNGRKILAVIYATKQLRKESLKKIQAWTGIEPMIYQVSYQANWELVILWARNIHH